MAAEKAEKKAGKPATPKKAEGKKVDAPKAAAAPAPAAAKRGPTPRSTAARGSGRTFVGLVKSDKMDKTVVVEVMSLKRDPVYGKYLRSRVRYKAHDEQNQFHTGDKVEIREHRPLSRDKRFVVSKLIERAKVE